MARKTNFFPQIENSPEPLEAECTRRVRFREVDLLGIVWHGHYPDFLEDARNAFGRKYDLSYIKMKAEGFLAPIVQMHFEYQRPLELDENFTIKVKLHWCESARLNFSYKIFREDGTLAADAYTVQIFTDTEKKALLIRPPYVGHFFKRWEKGELK